ncbi:MAG: hypothetical protein IJ779_03835 [Ruminococcus sp.]|nr:hypothetical protein [Ruminococcus sp.]
MNKLSSYIPSLIISVLLVLLTVGSSAALLVDINITKEKAFELIEEKNLGEVAQAEISKYYYKKYNSSGIPAEVYVRYITPEYMVDCERECIEHGFYSVEYDDVFDVRLPKNQKLEESISAFFSEYASKEGYKKDSNYFKKVEDSIDNAYNTVKSYSDVFKLSALNEHKVLRKLTKLYKAKNLLTIACIGIEVLLIAILILINRKNKAVTLYWTGISAVIAGLAGCIPSICLLASNYYDSFSIKQPAVFMAYTGVMYQLTRGFLAVSVAITIVGVCMLVIYGICHDKDKKQDVKPTTFGN